MEHECDFDFCKSSNQVRSLFVTWIQTPVNGWTFVIEHEDDFWMKPQSWTRLHWTRSGAVQPRVDRLVILMQPPIELWITRGAWKSSSKVLWCTSGYFLVLWGTSGYVAVLLGTLKNARDARESSSPKLKRRHKMLLHGRFSFGAASALSYFRYNHHLQSLKCCLQFQ